MAGSGGCAGSQARAYKAALPEPEGASAGKCEENSRAKVSVMRITTARHPELPADKFGIVGERSAAALVLRPADARRVRLKTRIVIQRFAPTPDLTPGWLALFGAPFYR